MKTYKYVGPHDAVDLAGVGSVDQGGRVDIEDPALSERMEAQPDNWEHIPDPKRSAAAKKAAATDKEA